MADSLGPDRRDQIRSRSRAKDESIPGSWCGIIGAFRANRFDYHVYPTEYSFDEVQMSRNSFRLLATLALVLFIEQHAAAQPARYVPGAAALYKMSPQPPRMNPPPPNPRVRPAASQTGLESTDFYPKRGYPRVLGDAVELGDVGGGGVGGAAGQSGAAGMTGAGGAAGNVSGQGFQGNIGNQIGSNTGGTIFGGIFGGGNQGGGFGRGVLGGGFRVGMSGGGFTGATPKGFGFGGVPN